MPEWHEEQLYRQELKVNILYIRGTQQSMIKKAI